MELCGTSALPGAGVRSESRVGELCNNLFPLAPFHKGEQTAAATRGSPGWRWRSGRCCHRAGEPLPGPSAPGQPQGSRDPLRKSPSWGDAGAGGAPEPSPSPTQTRGLGVGTGGGRNQLAAPACQHRPSAAGRPRCWEAAGAPASTAQMPWRHERPAVGNQQLSGPPSPFLWQPVGSQPDPPRGRRRRTDSPRLHGCASRLGCCSPRGRTAPPQQLRVVSQAGCAAPAQARAALEPPVLPRQQPR